MFIIGGEVYEDEDILGCQIYDYLNTPLALDDDDKIMNSTIDNLSLEWENKLRI